MAGRIEELLGRMTLEEKAGQLNLVPCDGDDLEATLGLIRAGLAGGVLKSNGAARNRRLQEAAVRESRLGIPVLFQDDVIHGHTTVFPIPLGEAATWDLEWVRRASEVAAREAAAAGIHLTYAPMVDVCRDARWGRVMETSGEDPFLGACMAVARVRGFQGEDPAADGRVLACAKHFAGYGDALAGVDYLVNEFSERALRETHLPPFQAAVEAGVAAVMCAYVAWDGVPATANQVLLDHILRGELGFGGMLVSDWETIANLVRAGVAGDLREAAALALAAGLDVDMTSGAVVRHLPGLVRDGVIGEEAVDAAVRRVLAAKEAAGLLDDPFRGCDEAREREVLLCPGHREVAREVARRSFVLLRNEGGVLPLRRGARIAVVGPLAKERRSPLGWWEGRGRPEDTVTLWEGMRQVAGEGTELVHAAGCRIEGFDAAGEEWIAEAVEIARGADVVVAAVGEWFDMSGEAGSRAGLDLPGAQTKLLECLAATGTPVVAVVYGGRPLMLTRECEVAAAVLLAWQPGTTGGLALADVLFGDHAPAGRLPMSMPRHAGQVPCYHGYRRGSHPHEGDGRYLCRQLDVPAGPLFPFGFGLGYTEFGFGPPALAADVLRAGESLEVVVAVTNVGTRRGRAVVQVYVRDEVCPVTQPELELKGFAAVELDPGESAEARVELRASDLRYWGADHRWHPACGWFTVFAGPDATRLQAARFRFLEE